MKKVKAIKFYEVIPMFRNTNNSFYIADGRGREQGPLEIDFSPKAQVFRMMDPKEGSLKYVHSSNVVWYEPEEDWLLDKVAVDPRKKK